MVRHELTGPGYQYMPTPKAMEMTRYGHLSPDLNGGTMSFDIPVYTYSDKDFDIPISLHYYSEGFRPAQQTGEAGLGWTLMAGGAITREIVGLDDFKTGGMSHFYGELNDDDMYSLSGTVGFSPTTGQAYFGNYDQLELTSDIYHFMMPGHYGSFMLVHKGQGKFKVFGTGAASGTYKVEYDSRYDSFTIRTGDGYLYVFGSALNEKSKEKNYNRLPTGQGESASSLNSDDVHYVTWFLDSITAPNGRTVHFKYIGNSFSSTIPQDGDDVITTFGQHLTHIIDDTGGNNVNIRYYKTVSITSACYLKRIVVDSLRAGVDKFTVDFDWNRQTNPEVMPNADVAYSPLVKPARKLSEIIVKCGNKTIRRAVLNYFDKDRRPFLRKVLIQGLGAYDMSYSTYGNNSTLPDILTNALDFWGFYNGRTDVPDESIIPTRVNEDCDEYIYSSIKNPNWNYSRLGMLTSITYPTGGWTNISYEANTAHAIVLRRRIGGGDVGFEPADPVAIGSSDPFLAKLFLFTTIFPEGSECGGVRVSALTDNDGSGHSSTRYFSYSKTDTDTRSSGVCSQFPRYYQGYLGSSVQDYNPSIRFPGSSFDSRHISYDRVTETLPDGSSIVSEFSGWNDIPDAYSPYYSNVDGFSDHNNFLQEDIKLLNRQFIDNALREPDSMTYRRGRLKKRTYRDLERNIVKSEVYQYQDSDEDYTSYIIACNAYWRSARRFLCDRRPSSVTVNVYPDGAGSPLIETMNFTYDNLGHRISTIRRTGTYTEERRQSFTGDMEGAGIYALMQDAGMLSLPVENTIIRNGKVSESSLTTYASFDDRYLPSARYYSAAGAGIDTTSFTAFTGTSINMTYGIPEKKFLSYDSLGNPTVSQDRAGIPTTIIRTADERHPAAIVVGADNGEKQETLVSVHNDWDESTLNSVHTKTVVFFTDTTGYFAFNFRGSVFLSDSSNNTGLITATLDGTTIPVEVVNSINGDRFFSYIATVNNMMPAGRHSLVLTAREPGLSPFEPFDTSGDIQTSSSNVGDSPDALEWKMSGTLKVSYPITSTSVVNVAYESVLFEDFESTGISGSGFKGSKGCTGGYSKTITAEKDRSYVLGYMHKIGNVWSYECESLAPSSDGSIAISIMSSASDPIDNVFLFPSDADGEVYGWSPEGLLFYRTDSRGITTSYAYDSLGRLVSVKDNDDNTVTSYVYSVPE